MDNVVGLARNTPHDPCTMMTILASVVVVAQSLEQGPRSSFLTRLVGKVVAIVVEFCVLFVVEMRCEHIFVSGLVLCFFLVSATVPCSPDQRCELCSGAFDTVVRVTATTNSSAAVQWVSTS